MRKSRWLQPEVFAQVTEGVSKGLPTVWRKGTADLLKTGRFWPLVS